MLFYGTWKQKVTTKSSSRVMQILYLDGGERRFFIQFSFLCYLKKMVVRIHDPTPMSRSLPLLFEAGAEFSPHANPRFIEKSKVMV